MLFSVLEEPSPYCLIRLFICDKDEREAWLTFEHEVYEYKFKEVTYAYRTLINSLIEAFEKQTYERKEKFLEFLPRISQVVREEKAQRVRFPCCKRLLHGVF